MTESAQNEHNLGYERAHEAGGLVQMSHPVKVPKKVKFITEYTVSMQWVQCEFMVTKCEFNSPSNEFISFAKFAIMDNESTRQNKLQVLQTFLQNTLLSL